MHKFQAPLGIGEQNKGVLKLISSMATRLLLSDAAALWQQQTGVQVAVESVGGLDAAKRVQAGEAFDGVVLAQEAIAKLIVSGHVVPGSQVDQARSSVAIAIKAGAPLPDIGTEAALRSAVVAAPSIGYSTGPSGVAIIKLFERWGLAQTLQSKIIQTPPGLPVGMLVASGEITLGFQQLSELMHLEGITVAGTLPEEVAINTIFSAAACSASGQREDMAAFLTFMASSQCDALRLRHGMTSF